MATQLYFSRDTKVYIEFGDKVWEVPVLDGFSFSQGNNSSEITLNEMESTGGISRRGRRAFNDSLAPGEWSMSTYVRPFQSAGNASATTGGADGDANMVHAVEEVLWAMMAGANAYDTAKFDYENTLVINATDMVQGETYEIVSAGNTDFTATNVGAADSNAGTVFTRGSAAATGTGTVKRKVTAHTAAQNRVSFHASNSSTLGTANIYFVLGDANRTVMKLKDAVVNEAGVDFEIDGISTINWSGQCSEVLDFSGSTHVGTTIPSASGTPDTTHDGSNIAAGDVWLDSDDSHRLYIMTGVGASPTTKGYAINEAITDTSNFIRNRLTTLSVNGSNTTGLLSSYDLTLTGGNVTISNNISFITPEEIGLVNVPIGHVTGTRSISGSFTCYLAVNDAARDGSGTKSRDLFEDLRALTSTVTNNVNLTFSIGGGSGNRLEIGLPTCHLEIPTHSIDDVISLETNFQALPATIDDTNEATLTYKV